MKLPSLSPVAVPVAACTDCSRVMNVKMLSNSRTGKLEGIEYSCDHCGYIHRASMQHISGESRIMKAKNAEVQKR